MKVTPGKAILIAFAGFAAKSELPGSAVFEGFDRVSQLADAHLAVSPLNTVDKGPEGFLMGFCGTAAGITDEGPEEDQAEALVRAFLEALRASPQLMLLLATVTVEESVFAAEELQAERALTEQDLIDVITAADAN